MSTKACACCGVRKPESDFPINRESKDQLHSYCSECNRVKSKEYAAANREKAYARVRAWRAANPERYRAQYRKNSDATPGLPANPR